MSDSSQPENNDLSYTGRVIWYEPLQLWETPSEDVAAFVGAEDHNLIETCRRSRKAAKAPPKPDEATLWRPAPEHQGKRRVRKIQPLRIFLKGMEYLDASMIRPYPGFRAIMEALSRPPPEAHTRDASEAETGDRPKSLELEPIPMSGELRIRDYDLGVRLDYADPQDVRNLIKRHMGSLLEMGSTPTVSAQIRGKPVPEYYLNRRQAIFITVKSETDAATDLTIEIIHKFDAYESGVAKQRVPANAEVLTKLGELEQQNAIMVSKFGSMLEMVKALVESKTRRRMGTAEVEIILQRNAQIGAAKALMEAKPNEHIRQAIAGIVQTQVFIAAKALQDGTLDQKIAEQKTKRRGRGSQQQTKPPEDEVEFDFGFDD